MMQDSNDRQFWSGSQCGDLRIQTNQTTANIIANQSQDYIDEQLAEFQEQIHRLQGKFILLITTFLTMCITYLMWAINFNNIFEINFYYLIQNVKTGKCKFSIFYL